MTAPAPAPGTPGKKHRPSSGFRQQLSYGLPVAVSLAVLTWSWSTMRGEQDRASRATGHARQAQQLSRQIVTLRDRPKPIMTATIDSPDLVRQVSAAAAKAGVDAKELDRIEPDPPQRVTGTVYQRIPIHVILRRADLPKLMHLLHTLQTDGNRLQTEQIRLIAPRDEADPAIWKAELTLSYMIYSPATDKPRKGSS